MAAFAQKLAVLRMADAALASRQKKEPRVTTRRAAVKLPRKGDVGHVLIGVGHYFECSCGVKGSRQSSYRAAMQAGREHAAAHTAEASADV